MTRSEKIGGPVRRRVIGGRCRRFPATRTGDETAIVVDTCGRFERSTCGDVSVILLQVVDFVVFLRRKGRTGEGYRNRRRAAGGVQFGGADGVFDQNFTTTDGGGGSIEGGDDAETDGGVVIFEIGGSGRRGEVEMGSGAGGAGVEEGRTAAGDEELR